MWIIALGMITIVFSWDYYLLSISKKKLSRGIYGNIRFYIDIVLVFVYMIFLISSKNTSLWPGIMLTIFSLYVAWDFFTIKQYPSLYNCSIDGNSIGIFGVFGVYTRSVFNDEKINRGPIITLTWTVYFVILNLNYIEREKYDILFFVGMAALGVIAYRVDKSCPSSRKDGQNGWGMGLRLFVFSILSIPQILFPGFDSLKDYILTIC